MDKNLTTQSSKIRSGKEICWENINTGKCKILQGTFYHLLCSSVSSLIILPTYFDNGSENLIFVLYVEREIFIIQSSVIGSVGQTCRFL